MQSVILMRGADLLAPAVIYSDVRAKREIAEIERVIGAQRLVEVTGNLSDASSLLAKLMWIRENQPDLYAQSEKLLVGAHDYIAWKLCGQVVTDYTTASTTGMFDLEHNTWSKELLDAVGVRTDWLPALAPAEQMVGVIHPAAALETGLPAGLPVFHGAGDAASATIGSGAGESGSFYVYLGTSGWLATTGSNQRINPSTGMWNLRHPDPARLMMIGPMLTTAGNLEWLSEQFGALELGQSGGGSSTHAAIMSQAANSPAGSGGVLYLPYLAGERSPFRDPNARAVFFGINRQTSRADLYRAVLEGVAYSIRSIREALLPSIRPDVAIRELSLVGGGARSALWAQIFADVMNCPVNVLSSPEDVGAKGTAILAGKALGWFSSYIPDPSYFAYEHCYLPDPETAAQYDTYYAVFTELVPALKPVFNSLAKVAG